MKLISSDDVECTLRTFLQEQGYQLKNRTKRHGEGGCDVEAIKGKEHLWIEVIGFQGVGSIRSREFYECFFRVISRDRGRLNDHLIMALPIRFADGMTQRRARYRRAWPKIGNAFPNLEIWYVNTESGAIKKYSWNKSGLKTSNRNKQIGHAYIREKESKRYDGKPFLYWWDISPGKTHDELLRNKGRYVLVEKDTKKHYVLTAKEMKKHLVPSRQTRRANGNWGLKVLKRYPGRIALEPVKKRGQEWLFLC